MPPAGAAAAALRCACCVAVFSPACHNFELLVARPCKINKINVDQCVRSMQCINAAVCHGSSTGPQLHARPAEAAMKQRSEQWQLRHPSAPAVAPRMRVSRYEAGSARGATCRPIRTLHCTGCLPARLPPGAAASAAHSGRAAGAQAMPPAVGAECCGVPLSWMGRKCVSPPFACPKPP